jgi:hypothetical protein
VVQESPKIDRRTAGDVEAELQEALLQLRDRDPEWANFEPGFGLSSAMIGIFSRLAEIVIRRLNGVPEKNFLAFLDLLGAAPLPPQPARVPLTFTLAAGVVAEAVVRPGTQVAAPPAEGEKEPIIYETERELVVTAARLDSVFVREPEQDRFADRSGLVAAPVPSGEPVFAGDQRIEHIFYLGHNAFFALPGLEEIRLRISLTKEITPDPPESVQPDARFLKWEIWDGARGISLSPSLDTTFGLTHSGDVVFSGVTLMLHSPFPQLEVAGTQSRWLRCRLLTPITTSSAGLDMMVRESQLPSIESVKIVVRLDSNNQGLPPDAAFANALPLDTTKDFLPFGDNPKYGDAFYFANREVLSKAGATIILKVKSTDPASAGIKPPAASNDLKLRWEYWNGSKWSELATVDKNGAASIPARVPPVQFTDTTKAFTATTGSVSFTLPRDAAATTVNGVENIWVRVRVVAGNYGVPASYEPINKDKLADGYKLIDATLAPPSLSSLTADYNLITEESKADALVAYNDFAFEGSILSIKPFRPSRDKEPTLYLGFSLPRADSPFPNRKLSLFADAVAFKHGEKYGHLWPTRSKKAGNPGAVVEHRFWLTNESALPARFTLQIYGSAWRPQQSPSFAVDAGKSEAVKIPVTIPGDATRGAKDRGFLLLKSIDEPGFEYGATFETFALEEETAKRSQLSWEYWNGREWATLAARDDSRGFVLPGLIEFIAPGDFALHSEFGLDRFWLRVRLKSGEYKFAPHLRRLLLNTMMAAQTVTSRDEVLGSSDASGNQRRRSTRAPVLPGERLEVREPEMPSADETARIMSEEGDDAIRAVRDAAGLAKEIWVRWHSVPDFYSSGARDRHYVLDRLTGEVRFGDGLNGMIPPAMTGNLRLRFYQTGGGASGNRPAGVITQLKTTVPYIDKVVNFAPATGGADAEDLSSLIARAPRTLRHGDRAVTVEDYEDLAKLASPEVARVKCVPLYDLASDPDATRQQLGFVSLIIVPRSVEPKPVPSLELLSRVRDYLDLHRSLNADIAVVGPDYMRVDVEATLGVKSLEGAREVEVAVSQALARFLHPLTGGLDGEGWDFGRKPHRSDLYALLEDTLGVDHVIRLHVDEFKERADAATTERFLVYSGTHKISLMMEES